MTVSARLMQEILDRFHGPDKHKLWLLAWAETASEATRSGWCPRRVIAARVGVSERHASRIASALVDTGVLKRDGRAHNGRAAVFVLADLDTRKRDINGVPLHRHPSGTP